MINPRHPAHRIVLALALLVAATVAEGEQEMIPTGEPFVDFELEAHDGTTVSLADLEGRPFLLFFYPKASTPGWTLEANQLRDSWNELEELGIAVLGISYDSPQKNRAFAEKNNLPFLLLSDSNHDVAKAVGASRTVMPFAKRVSYLVAADGKVLKAYPKVDPSMHAQEVLEDFKALISVGD
jgi:peroxiredoxin Q/BCP